MRRPNLVLPALFLMAGWTAACQDSSPLATEVLFEPQFGKKNGPCTLYFDLVLDDALGVRSDRVPPNHGYSSGVDRVLVFAGNFGGFRFDTNGSQQKEAANDIRRVQVVILTGMGSPSPLQAHATATKGIDLRFNTNVQAVDFCGLTPGGAGVQAAAGFTFESSINQSLIRINYGGIAVNGDNCGARGVSPLTLTRRVTGNEWDVVSGPFACLYASEGGMAVFKDVVKLPIAFSLKAQGSVP